MESSSGDLGWAKIMISKWGQCYCKFCSGNVICIFKNNSGTF